MTTPKRGTSGGGVREKGRVMAAHRARRTSGRFATLAAGAITVLALLTACSGGPGGDAVAGQG
ncbi:MAG: hypothetical protein LH461_05175, partial [Spirochaetaceae bacterium]|nr:hypothetical protein [Spirochaetaceae bacterium]